MSDQRLTVSIRGNGPEAVGYIRAAQYPHPGPGTDPDNDLLSWTEITAYWHAAEGGTPYLVVEVDGDSPMKIVRYDNTLFEENL